MKTVFVLKGDSFDAVCKMFRAKGWNVVTEMAAKTFPGEVDLVCFIGGADVSPHLYGEENISSHCDPMRDVYEQQVYEEFLSSGVPMVGICRGGQFLNVMNDGKMIQDIPKGYFGMSPISGDIVIREDLDCPNGVDGCGDLITCQRLCFKNHEVRVDHHQGMIPSDCAEIIHSSKGGLIEYTIWYSSTRCLCFQPHPEWGHQGTHDLFFDLLEEYLNV